MNEKGYRAAKRFFDRTGGRSLERRIADMERDAALHLDEPRVTPEMTRWAARHVKVCAEVFQIPLPPILLKLTLRVMNPRSSRTGPRTRKMYIAAVQFVAAHPEADARQICRGIDYPQTQQVQTWMQSDDFIDAVEHERAILAATSTSSKK